MSKSLKWILAAMLAMSVVVVVRASLQTTQYLPIVARNPTPTPTTTATPTVTPTPTKTPSPTKTPNTPCLSLETSGVCIIEIDPDPSSGGPLNEFIRLKNLSNNAVDMEDWRISSDSGNKYNLTFKFSLSSNATVKIWTKSGDNDTDELFMDREDPFWNDHEDCAYVINDEGEKVDSICFTEDDTLGLMFFSPPVTAP